jgi:hypothetical protein
MGDAFDQGLVVNGLCFYALKSSTADRLAPRPAVHIACAKPSGERKFMKVKVRTFKIIYRKIIHLKQNTIRNNKKGKLFDVKLARTLWLSLS